MRLKTLIKAKHLLLIQSCEPGALIMAAVEMILYILAPQMQMEMFIWLVGQIHPQALALQLLAAINLQMVAEVSMLF